MDLLIARMGDPTSKIGGPITKGSEASSGNKPSQTRESVSKHDHRSSSAHPQTLDGQINSSDSKDIDNRAVSDGKYISKNTVDTSSVPGIAVNDKPILMRQPSAKNLAALSEAKEKEKRRTRHRSSSIGRHEVVDYTAADTGTFSAIMFENDEHNEEGSSSNSSSSNNFSVAIKPRLSSTAINAGLYQTATLDKSNKRGGHVMDEDIKKHRHHDRHRSGEISSKSESFVNDNKRLVHQFLKSMEPPKRSKGEHRIPLFTSEDPMISQGSMSRNSKSVTPDNIMASNKSLQSLLYHDLEETPNHTTNSFLLESMGKLNIKNGSSSSSVSTTLSTTSSSSGTSSSYSDLSSSNSSEQITKSQGGSVNSIGRGTNLNLAIDDLDFLQSHITSKLKQFEFLMKTNLKDIILRKETDLSKSLQNFDLFYESLNDFRTEISNLQRLVKDDYLRMIKRDFNDKDKESFTSQLKVTVEESAKHLEELESRMKVCQQKLIEQKDAMKKMDSLLFIENSMIETEKSRGIAFRYRYIIYDGLTFVCIVMLAIVIKNYLVH